MTESDAGKCRKPEKILFGKWGPKFLAVSIWPNSPITPKSGSSGHDCDPVFLVICNLIDFIQVEAVHIPQ